MHTATFGTAALKELPAVDAPSLPRHLTAVLPHGLATEQIPDPPERFVRVLATKSFEAVEGTRSIAQLGAAISVGAARQLAAQRAALHERRDLYRDSRNCLPSPGNVQLCRVDAHLAEATVVLHAGSRARAVALRLEWAHGRWRACEIYVL